MERDRDNPQSAQNAPTGARVVASHLKAKGANYWGSSAAAISLIERARDSACSALVLTLALFAAVRSRFVRGRLVFSAWLFLAFLGLELAVSQGLGDLDAPAEPAPAATTTARETLGQEPPRRVSH